MRFADNWAAARIAVLTGYWTRVVAVPVGMLAVGTDGEFEPAPRAFAVVRAAD